MTERPATISPKRGACWLAFAWGFAEATFFFVVPDVLTTRLVLQNPRDGFVACLGCLAGALPGGVLLFYLGQDPHLQRTLAEAMARLPGINDALFEQAGTGLQNHGLVALIIGVLAGIPYKLYALQAAVAGSSLSAFLLVSTVARLSRFLVVTGGAWLIGDKLLANLNLTAKWRIHAGSWLLFYAVYFWRMGR